MLEVLVIPLVHQFSFSGLQKLLSNMSKEGRGEYFKISLSDPEGQVEEKKRPSCVENGNSWLSVKHVGGRAGVHYRG